jgi:L-seryl-tRNA(Ser) seleniumtransferase
MALGEVLESGTEMLLHLGRVLHDSLLAEGLDRGDGGRRVLHHLVPAHAARRLPRAPAGVVRTEVESTLPYARGEILAGTEDDLAKLRAAWRIIRNREVFDFTGLERSLVLPETAPELLDDELAPALYAERMTALALDHLGGSHETHDVFLANRTTAALVAAMQVLVRPGARVVGVSPSYTHPAAVRAVRLAGGEFEEEGTLEGADLVLLTRLAVTYDALALEEVQRAVDSRIPVFVDDAGGARVGPAVFGQPKMLELGVVGGVTGLDKYGTTGPRLGLLGGERELVRRIRARAVELGLEARPML